MAIQKRPTSDGRTTYTAKVYLRRVNGKRREVSKTFATRREAKVWEAGQRQALATGTFVEPSQTWLGAYLESWLDGASGLRARERTRRDYRSLLTRYLLKADVAMVPLAKVTTAQLEAHYSRLREQGGEGGKPLGDRTVRLLHAIVRAALERARKGRLLAYNPAADVEFAPAERREMVALTVPQMQAFLAASHGTKWHALWCLLFHGGLRPSEALGLQWEDVLSDGVRVRQALVTGLKDGWKLLPPKTRASVRVVGLPDEAMTALAEHRAKQEVERIAGGSRYVDHQLVFASQLGAPVDLKNLAARHWRPLLAKAGLATVRVYDARHTHASHAFAAGVPIPVVAARLGHANPRVTLSVYAHLLEGQESDAVQRITDYVASVR